VSAAFTPGPWQVNATVHCDRKNIFGLNPTAAFHVGTLVSGSKSKLDLFEANARLIAAAPELYEALADTLPRNVCLTNGSVGDETIIPLECTMGELRRISQLLAKARGEA
jgi:hypothetical protein